MGDILRRYRKNSGASQYAHASYSEVYDMHTEVGKTTLIGIHTPITTRWQSYLGGFCKQFSKFRYKGASLSFVPVTTLPADPLQVSYEAGEPTIDPRDLMNPIIHCGMRGQSMGNYLDEIFRFNISEALSALDVVNIPDDTEVGGVYNETLEQAYYTALSAPNFRKSHVQSGFRKNGLHPMVYELSSNRPYNYTSIYGYTENIDFGPDAYNPTSSSMGVDSPRSAADDTFSSEGGLNRANLTIIRNKNEDGTQSDYGQFFTSRCHGLGWLDTLQRGLIQNAQGNWVGNTRFTGLPKVYMYFVMLPPAYKTEMYFRVIVRHFFEFRDFRPLSGPFSFWSANSYPYDGVIQNEPIEQANALSESEPISVATLDVYNGTAELVSDGAM